MHHIKTTFGEWDALEKALHNPKNPQELALAARMCLENYNNGEIYQYMFGKPESLLADVLVRYNTGQIFPKMNKSFLMLD